jgi:hypothetical protein
LSFYVHLPEKNECEIMVKKIYSVIIVAVLTALTFIPIMGDAAEGMNTGARINASQIQLPALQFNTSQEKVIVKGELSPEQASTVSQFTSTALHSYQIEETSTIPYGSIIYHSDNVTTVFDASGNQLFSADDTQADLIPVKEQDIFTFTALSVN